MTGPDPTDEMVKNYLDIRALLDEFERHLCPKCGVERWFKWQDRDHWEVGQWNCMRCGSYLTQTLERPCPECGIRMVLERATFRCHNQACDHRETVIDRAGLIDALTGEFDTAGYQYSVWQECPVCGERSILNGPDGERSCDKCGKFYAGQFSEQWFCYALWLGDPGRIRVNVDEEESA